MLVEGGSKQEDAYSRRENGERCARVTAGRKGIDEGGRK